MTSVWHRCSDGSGCCRAWPGWLRSCCCGGDRHEPGHALDREARQHPHARGVVLGWPVGAGNPSPLCFGEFELLDRSIRSVVDEPRHDHPSPDHRPAPMVARDRRRARRRDPRPAPSDPGAATPDQPAPLHRHRPHDPRGPVDRVRTVTAASDHADRAAQDRDRLAPSTRRPPLDLPTHDATRPTANTRGDPPPRDPSRDREPDMGLPTRPRRAVPTRPPDRRVDGLDDPASGRDRPGPRADRTDLGTVHPHPSRRASSRRTSRASTPRPCAGSMCCSSSRSARGGCISVGSPPTRPDHGPPKPPGTS